MVYLLKLKAFKMQGKLLNHKRYEKPNETIPMKTMHPVL